MFLGHKFQKRNVLMSELIRSFFLYTIFPFRSSSFFRFAFRLRKFLLNMNHQWLKTVKPFLNAGIEQNSNFFSSNRFKNYENYTFRASDLLPFDAHFSAKKTSSLSLSSLGGLGNGYRIFVEYGLHSRN